MYLVDLESAFVLLGNYFGLKTQWCKTIDSHKSVNVWSSKSLWLFTSHYRRENKKPFKIVMLTEKNNYVIAPDMTGSA